MYYNAFETELGLPIDGTTAVSADKANAYYDAKGFMTVDANSAFTQTQCINYAHTAGISTITTGDVAAAGEVLTAVNAACTAAELPTVTAGDAYTAIQVYAYVATLEGALKTTDKKIYANVLKYNAVMEGTCIIPATAIIAAVNFATAIAYNATVAGAVTTADARVPARTGRRAWIKILVSCDFTGSDHMAEPWCSW